MLGMIGGLGPESTVEYYREMFRKYREHVSDGSMPSFVLNSVDVSKVFAFVTAGDLAALAEYLRAEVVRLADAGATFGMICANMPHIVFNEVKHHSPIPLISIVETACKAAKLKGLRKAGLFGTRFTMQGRFYPEVFTREGIEIITPRTSEQNYIHDVYVNELLIGIVRPEAREQLLAIVDRMAQEDGIDGLLLGGTELSLILKELPGRNVELLDTMKIHVEAAVKEMLA